MSINSRRVLAIAEVLLIVLPYAGLLAIANGMVASELVIERPIQWGAAVALAAFIVMDGSMVSGGILLFSYILGGPDSLLSRSRYWWWAAYAGIVPYLCFLFAGIWNLGDVLQVDRFGLTQAKWFFYFPFLALPLLVPLLHLLIERYLAVDANTAR